MQWLGVKSRQPTRRIRYRDFEPAFTGTSRRDKYGYNPETGRINNIRRPIPNEWMQNFRNETKKKRKNNEAKAEANAKAAANANAKAAANAKAKANANAKAKANANGNTRKNRPNGKANGSGNK